MCKVRWLSSLWFAVFAVAASSVSAQCVSLTTLGSASTQNFDTLSNTVGSTTNNLTITGWFMTETGGGARDNEQYAVDTGASNTGDTYSYGSAAATERALGGLRSGTLMPVFGACFTNNTGATISSLGVAYTGEEWRLGTAARTDQIDFQYSLNATDLATGAWVDVNALDFVTPDTATTGAKNGNAAASRTALSSTIGSLSIANGATFWIRWNDLDASGADDGLSVDDFSLTPQGAVVLPNLTINDVSQTEGNSGTTTFTFTVSLSAPAGAGGVTFDIGTAANTATAPSDFVNNALTGQTIPAGSSTYAFNVQVNGDAQLEADETFFVNVTNVTGATVTDGQGQGTISNDDTVPVLIAETSPTVLETAGSVALFTLSPQAIVPVPLSINLTLTGTAVNGAGNDYTTSAIPVVIPANTGSVNLTVTLLDNSVFESDETIIVTIDPGTNYVPATGEESATVTIEDNEDRPDADFSAATGTALEGNSGTSNYVATVNLTAAAGVALDINYSTADGGGMNANATAPSDYTDTVGTLTIPAGQVSGTISVPIVGDTTFEPNEDFSLSISTPAPPSITRAPKGLAATQVVTISNDDAATPAASISVAPTPQPEDQGPFVYTVTLNPAPVADTTVNFTVSGSATSGADFNPLGSTSVVVLAGQTTATVPVSIIEDNLANENSETVVLTLAVGAGYTITAGSDVATASITDNDSVVVSIAVAPAAVFEDAATALTYTMTPSNPSAIPLTVDFSITGTATAGTDYPPVLITFGIPANSTAAQVIAIDPSSDTTVEPDETIILTLVGGIGYSVSAGNDVATGTITNDDSVTANIAVAPAIADENAGTAFVYTITLSPAPITPTAVKFNATGSATQGTDYPTIPLLVSNFAVGETTQTVNVTATGDTLVEADETVTLTLEPGAGYVVGLNDAASATIRNDDFSADVSFTVTDAPDPVLPGGQITYQIDLNNAGPSPAANVTLSFPLPPALTFVSLTTPGWGCTAPLVGATGTVTCNTPSLPVGTASFTLVAQVPANAVGGTSYPGTVTVTSDTPDPTPGNNVAALVSTTVSAGNVGTPTPVPSLDHWGRMLLVLMMLSLVWIAGRQRQQ